MTLLLIHAGATLYMAGLIWFVQLVHYPLMAKVGRDGYAEYQRLHERRTGWAVGPAMLVELGTAVALVVARPERVEPWLAWLGLAMLGVIWLSTACLQVPRHKQLGAGFNEETHRKLVTTNWLRTALWSVRGVIALVILSS
jgi:uncharacterized membrane protein